MPFLYLLRTGFSCATALAVAASSIYIASYLGTSNAHAASNAYASGSTAPVGYGAAWNLLTAAARELLVQATDCTASSATMKVGSGNSAQYVYNKGYYWSCSKWNEYTFTGTSALQSNAWHTGSAQATIPLPQAVTYAVGYVCQQQNGTWKCGCRDSTCSTAYWQLQGLTGAPADRGGGGSGSGGGGAGGPGGGGSGSYAVNATYDNHPLGTYTVAMKDSDFPGWHTDKYGWDKFDIVDEGGGKKALRTWFEGCNQPKHLYMPLPSAREWILETAIRFSPNFVTAQKPKADGKLWFGIQGSDVNKPYAPTGSIGASWSYLFLYRGGNANEQLQDYVYHADRPGTWGEIFARFGNKSPDWHQLKLHAKLNTPGSNDGFAKLWYDGKQVVNKSNLRFIGNGYTGTWDQLRFLGTIGGNCNASENYFTEKAYIDYAYHRLYKP